MNRQRHEFHLLTGAYAADALTGAELAEFEKHLDKCPACAEEVRGLRETTARLAMATAIAPPPGMREQVLAAASRTRQLPPSSRKRPAPGVPRVLRRPVTAIAATAAAAAIVVLAVFQAGTEHQLQQAQADNRAVAAVLSAPDARIETSAAAVGGTVTAVISSHDLAAVITAAGMPVPSGSKVYQLWVIGPSGARSAGLLPARGSGAAGPVLADDVQPGDHLGVTIEPAGGSARPTTTPIALLTDRG